MDIGRIDFELATNFTARGEILSKSSTLPAIITSQCSRYGYDPVRCTVFLENEVPLEMLLGNDLSSYQKPLSLKVERENRHTTLIPLFRLENFSENRLGVNLEGVADFYLSGNLDKFDAS